MGKRSLARSHDEELILAHLLGVERSWVIAHPKPPLTEIQRHLFKVLCQERVRGIPLAYLLGKKEFYGREFVVGQGVLIPRPETEHLVEEALTFIPSTGQQVVVDLGTGSGCIAISIACERPSVSVVATDISRTALRYARTNIDRHGVAGRVQLLHGDLLQPLLHHGIIPDLVVANLPYLTPLESNAVPFEPRGALIGGRDGLIVFRRLFTQLSMFPKQPTIILEVDPRRAHEVQRIARRNNPKSDVMILRDLAGFDRVLVVRPRELGG